MKPFAAYCMKELQSHDLGIIYRYDHYNIIILAISSALVYASLLCSSILLQIQNNLFPWKNYVELNT